MPSPANERSSLEQLRVKERCQQYYKMLDNYLEQEYHSYDEIYTHSGSRSKIYIGDFQSATDSEFHSRCNIKTIITAATNMEHLEYDPTIKHIVYPLLDSKNQNIANLFRDFYEVIETQAPLGSMLVHCSAGISRSSTLVISYIMRKEKLLFKQAIAFVRKSRPKVLPNLGFERQLKKYEDTLRQSMRSERVPRRIQVRTSQSGKSQRSIRVDLFPFADAFPSLPFQRLKPNDKVKHCLNQLSTKGINLIRLQKTQRKGFSRNHNSLADKVKKLNPSNRNSLKTQVLEKQEQTLFQLLKIQNRRVIKSKTIISEAASIEAIKREDPIIKHFSAYRKGTMHKQFEKL